MSNINKLLITGLVTLAIFVLASSAFIELKPFQDKACDNFVRNSDNNNNTLVIPSNNTSSNNNTNNTLNDKVFISLEKPPFIE